MLAIVIAAVLLIAVLLAFWCSRSLAAKKTAAREGYGPPPGLYRALTLEELGPDRGWPSYPFEYTANTASSISGLVRRSA
jgi:hypothetical protein